MALALKPRLTEAEYLAFSATAPLRYEYIAGDLHAMAGGSQRHNQIALNLAARLLTHLVGKPCQVFISDMKLHIAQDSVYYYPDVMVTCDAQGAVAGSAQAVNDPVLLVEVLSPHTETIDHREKLAAYRRIASVQEYLLLSQDAQHAELYRRQDATTWLYACYRAGDTLELASVELQLVLNSCYVGTDAA